MGGTVKGWYKPCIVLINDARPERKADEVN